MKVAISGSRGPDPSRGRKTGWDDMDTIARVVDRLIDRGDVERINVGDAPSGVDAQVAEYLEVGPRADEVPSSFWKVYEARWDVEGKPAGHNRNAWMISESDELIALFADGPKTPGTSNAVECAKRRGIPVHEYHEGRWT